MSLQLALRLNVLNDDAQVATLEQLRRSCPWAGLLGRQAHDVVNAQILCFETFWELIRNCCKRAMNSSLLWIGRPPDMKRLACAVLALSVVAAPGLMTVPAVAQTKMDCSRLYKDFWEKFDREKYAKISAEQLAGVSRMALRAYDACQAGDEQDARALFDRLSKMTF
jgi:hypothetical protein